MGFVGAKIIFILTKIVFHVYVNNKNFVKF
jgi:hypothetical protein